MKYDLQQLLTPPFDSKHISAALQHYSQMLSKFQKSEWEPTIAKTGKFVEAVLKALYVFKGNTVPPGRQFKVDQIITALQKAPAVPGDDSIRLAIPRASRLVYDIASNRGARHDPDEVNPNQIDANAGVMNCSWILSEMLRFAQKGALNMDQTAELVASLTQRKYPSIEEVDGRVYFHYPKLGAPDVAILTLAHWHPRRIHSRELLETVVRHQFTPDNARIALKRLKKLYDDDGSGRLLALAPCLQKADAILQQFAPRSTSAE